jgi:hypothetical protein
LVGIVRSRTKSLGVVLFLFFCVPIMIAAANLLQAPDVMDYVKKQAELEQTKQALKVWSHRKKIQHTALTSCRQLLHKLTANSLPSTRWARHVDHLLHIQIVNEYLK